MKRLSRTLLYLFVGGVGFWLPDIALNAKQEESFTLHTILPIVGLIVSYLIVKFARRGSAGPLTNDERYFYAYNATGQQVSSLHLTQFTQNGYDGDGLRGLKSENDVDTYYFRSSVLGGAVVAEIDGSGNWTKGYVYQGSQL